MKKIFKLLVITCLVFILCSCESDNNTVEIDVRDYGKIVIELYPEVAPRTVSNFKKFFFY